MREAMTVMSDGPVASHNQNLDPRAATPTAESLPDIYDAMATGVCGRRHAGDARREVRRPYPFLLTLVPVTDQGETLHEQPFTVVGKNLSSRGIGFFHKDPIPYRRVVVHLEGAAGRAMRALVELSWCRFTRHGWYDSGGRFLELTPMPMSVNAAAG